MSRYVQYCDACLRIIHGKGAFNLEKGTAYHISCAPASFRAPRPDIRESPTFSAPVSISALDQALELAAQRSFTGSDVQLVGRARMELAALREAARHGR